MAAVSAAGSCGCCLRGAAHPGGGPVGWVCDSRFGVQAARPGVGARLWWAAPCGCRRRRGDPRLRRRPRSGRCRRRCVRRWRLRRLLRPAPVAGLIVVPPHLSRRRPKRWWSPRCARRSRVAVGRLVAGGGCGLLWWSAVGARGVVSAAAAGVDGAGGCWCCLRGGWPGVVGWVDDLFPGRPGSTAKSPPVAAARVPVGVPENRSRGAGFHCVQPGASPPVAQSAALSHEPSRPLAGHRLVGSARAGHYWPFTPLHAAAHDTIRKAAVGGRPKARAARGRQRRGMRWKLRGRHRQQTPQHPPPQPTNRRETRPPSAAAQPHADTGCDREVSATTPTGHDSGCEQASNHQVACLGVNNKVADTPGVHGTPQHPPRTQPTQTAKQICGVCAVRVGGLVGKFGGGLGDSIFRGFLLV